LDRLTESIQRTESRRVVLLGDLLHSRVARRSRVIEQFNAWRDAHTDVALLLVRGNHDRRAGDPPSSWCMEPVDEPVTERPFVFRHKPQPSDQGYVLAGHLHPLVRLSGKGAQRLRLPCFHFAPEVGTLPAFSSLARGAEIRPTRKDRVYVVADGEVLQALP
jgi:DNA ligase-associated metallophosphoesterase